MASSCYPKAMYSSHHNGCYSLVLMPTSYARGLHRFLPGVLFTAGLCGCLALSGELEPELPREEAVWPCQWPSCHAALSFWPFAHHSFTRWAQPLSPCAHGRSSSVIHCSLRRNKLQPSALLAFLPLAFASLKGYVLHVTAWDERTFRVREVKL